jgi:pyroglutamyl-peptidase
MQHTILVTGFAPFDGEQMNPSWRVAKALHDWQPIAHHQVIAAELECAFSESALQLNELVAKHQPVLIIAIGQAGGRTQLSLEKVAINLIEARIPDNRGKQPKGIAVIADAPTAYFCQLPLKAMVKALHQQQIPAAISYTAGTYVCNSTFFHLCHLEQLQKIPVGFVHIPYAPCQTLTSAAPSMEIDLVIAGLKIIINTALSAQEIDYQVGTLD